MDRKTYFLDIDGTVLEYLLSFEESMKQDYLAPTPDASEKTQQWHQEGHMIIMTTARPESMRKITETQLRNANIVYDLLIMGIGSGIRILVNDVENPGGEDRAVAYNVVRNSQGLTDVK